MDDTTQPSNEESHSEDDEKWSVEVIRKKPRLGEHAATPESSGECSKELDKEAQEHVNKIETAFSKVAARMGQMMSVAMDSLRKDIRSIQNKGISRASQGNKDEQLALEEQIPPVANEEEEAAETTLGEDCADLTETLNLIKKIEDIQKETIACLKQAVSEGLIPNNLFQGEIQLEGGKRKRTS